MGNQDREPGRYCNWLHINCPATFRVGCQTRIKVDHLHEVLDRAEARQDNAATLGAEEELTELSSQWCPLESRVGRLLNQDNPLTDDERYDVG